MSNNIKNNETILEGLLSDKRPIKAPDGLEARIMQRVNSNKAENNFVFFVFRKNYMVFASVLTALVMLSAYLNFTAPRTVQNDQASITQADNTTSDDQEIQQLSNEDEYYDIANTALSQAGDDINVDDDAQDLDDLDSYIDWLQS